MKNVWEITRDDIRSIYKSLLVSLIVIALMLLPSVYAWINILASWDPYGNTSGILIGVSNTDKGANLDGKTLNIGQQIVDVLKDNKQLGWNFTTEKKAIDKVKEGKYYAAIIIPEDFTKKILTILSNNPTEPKIEYYVNEKINAIAPKITSKGTSSVVENVSKNFVKTSSEIIFSIFNQLGTKLERDLPQIEEMKRKVFWLEEHFPDLQETANHALDNIKKVDVYMGKANEGLTKVEELSNNKNELAESLKDYFHSINQEMEGVIPFIKNTLAGILDHQQTLLGTIATYKNNQTTELDLTQFTKQALPVLMAEQAAIGEIKTVLSRLNQLSTGYSLDNELSSLNRVAQNVGEQLQLLQSNATGEQLNRLLALTETNQDILGKLQSQLQGTTITKIKEVGSEIKNTLQNIQNTIEKGEQALPQLKTTLNEARAKLRSRVGEAENLQKKFPELEVKIMNLAGKMHDFDKDYNLSDIINLLRNDIEKESNFLSQPVDLKEHSLYPIPNYGSAMSPFYSILSLWVGATIMVSILSVSVEGNKYKPYQIYLGRYGIFFLIGIFQAIIVAMGNIYLLDTYVVDKGLFILSSIYSSIIFTLMVYTLVSVFGNVGKGIAIILMVLQVSSSGGTFPIQVTPTFFQLINPYLPFTYSISLLREAVGGIYWRVARLDILILSVFLVVTFLFGLILKTPLHKSTEAMMSKLHRKRIF